jgi:hypothetical protein
MEEMTSMSNVPFRRMIEACLGRNVPDQVWTYAGNEGYLQRYVEEQITLNALLAKLRGLLALAEPDTAPTETAPPMLDGDTLRVDPTSRDDMLSLVVAERVRQYPRLVQFRTAHLPDEVLLPWPEVEPWMKTTQHADAQAYPARYIIPEISLSGAGEPFGDIATLFADSPHEQQMTIKFRVKSADLRTTLRKQVVAYALPHEDHLRWAEVRQEGVLGELKDLAERLTQSAGWTEAQAVLYVLTGIAPRIESISARVELGNDLTTRIHLSIDPEASPREVAEMFRAWRKWFVGPRHRDMSPKHLMLALFRVQHPKVQEQVWSDLMVLWNAAHAEWAYEDPSHFARDYDQAFQRLTGNVEGGLIP